MILSMHARQSQVHMEHMLIAVLKGTDCSEPLLDFLVVLATLVWLAVNETIKVAHVLNREIFADV